MIYDRCPTEPFIEVVHLYDKILALPSLIPSPLVNEVFSRLVELCLQIKIPSKHLIEHLDDACLEENKSKFDVRALMQRAMEAEGCMERYWANIILNASESESGIVSAMQSFWYWDNYSLLTNYELYRCLSMEKVAFIGSGPLPLTSIMVGERTRGEVVLYNRDIQANAMASSWVQKLPNHGNGPHAQYTFRDADVWDITPTEFESYDVIWIAASVGIDGKEKRSIVNHVKKGMRSGAFLAVRSVEMGCSLLYPEVDHEELANMEVIRHDLPPQGVVNSVIVLRA
ncbi:Nicotianamine synthase [Hysterangium stoloniferum]|nr:Nicotianamine synthase [Hysterangium stoloniferum]